MKKHAWTAILCTLIGLLSGMLIHAWLYRSDPKVGPKEPSSVSLENKQSAADPEDSAPQNLDLSQNADLSSSKQLVEALFPGARIGGGEKNTPLDPFAQQVRGILRNPVSSYQKVATLMNLAKTLPPDQRRLAYAGAAFACEAREFQQLMLPVVWDPATPADQAQVLAGGVVGLPDPVRLPICLTFLKHPDESIRLTGQAVLSAYFPDAGEADYPALVQAYLRNPD